MQTENPTFLLTVIQLGGFILAILLLYVGYLQKQNNTSKKLLNDLLKENARLVIRLSKLYQPSEKKIDYEKAKNCNVVVTKDEI